jgi:hypothetical protein
MVGLAPEAIGPSVSHCANHRDSSNLQSTAFASHYKFKRIEDRQLFPKKMPEFPEKESGIIDKKLREHRPQKAIPR